LRPNSTRLTPLQKPFIDDSFLFLKFEAVRDEIRGHECSRGGDVNHLDNFAVLVSCLKIASRVTPAELRETRMREAVQSAACAIQKFVEESIEHKRRSRAWAEQDPVKLLDITMQITKFLAQKQQRLDAEYDAAFDEAQEVQKIKDAQEAVRKSGLN
jgi:hypothetical protein